MAWNAIMNAKLAREMMLDKLSRLTVADPTTSLKIMEEVRELATVIDRSMTELKLVGDSGK